MKFGRHRGGQSLVEFAVCLPFLLLLVGAIVDFGFMLHHKQQLWGVARAGALHLDQLGRRPRGPELIQVRQVMVEAGRSLGIGLDDVEVLPSDAHPGFMVLSASRAQRRMSPVNWSPAFRSRVEVRLRVLVEVSP